MLGAGTFLLTPGSLTIYVPYASLEAYRTAEGWKDYANQIAAYPRTLTVAGGTGGGSVTPGAEVSVAAGAAPEGQHFAGWAVTAGSLTLTDEQRAGSSLTFTMPDSDVTLTATYESHAGGKATCGAKAVCEVCGAEYGNVDPDNHAALKAIAAVPATCTQDGREAYWHCDGCGKDFVDAAATQEVTDPADLVVPASGHSYEDGVCTVCGAPEPDHEGKPSTGTGTGTDDTTETDDALADTGDASAAVAPLLVTALAAVTGAAALHRKR